MHFTQTIFYIMGCLLIISACTPSVESEKPEEKINGSSTYAMVIHGGAGTILKADMTEELEKAYHQSLTEALTIGEEILKSGGSALDAVEQTIRFMEDSPLYNAGHGAVFTHKGINELDASFMNGADLNAGAVGGVTVVKHPISAARAVLEHSEHVFLNAEGAEVFAREQGLEIVPRDYFYTERRWQALQKIIEAEKKSDTTMTALSESKHGTVGCVALDKDGNIAAGTSTGGMTNKRYNRIGDSPIIGAGTYANNQTCGISCTGHGEYFIRLAVAHDISLRMEYLGESVSEAAHQVIHKKLTDMGGTGGVVGLDKHGNVAMVFNSEGMYRGYIKPGERVTSIYKDETPQAENQQKPETDGSSGG